MGIAGKKPGGVRKLPTLPCRVHFDADASRYGSSWTGEIRACVDGEYMVIREYSRSKKRWFYRIEDMWFWNRGDIRIGPLPKKKR